MASKTTKTAKASKTASKAKTPAAKTATSAMRKAATGKPVTKTAPAKTDRAKPGPKRLGKTQLEALKLIAKKGPLTRSQISEALGGVFIGGSIGHVDPAKLEASSLLGRGFVAMAVADGPATYSITPPGRKALEVAAE